MSSTLILLIDIVGGLFVMAILLRFLLQLVKADFYNPISQGIVKVTSPLLNPLRRIIPGFGGFDLASLILAFIVQCVLVMLKMKIAGYMIFGSQLPTIALLSVQELLFTLLNIYQFALLIMVIASWVAPSSYHPGLILLHQLTEPLCSRVRKFIPPMGGLDFSIMVLFIAIILLKNMVATMSILPGM
ncbi:YggT family protein [Parendozoicomonas haliclonae]|uniref:YGGT family protein n=1 Tax=Parendozoicomonas haliclonae TaxID=1960125 RepID=A0A1X7AJ44_9GAMM|nr:YggT family protein [Parendozoicomonas haliclonae]SMA46166.1 YGGT family protein [Parendozoicomonas haliclonae]